MATGRRERIAILGGGLGGLSTAFELSSHPGWQDRYEITIYQSGWRLGGKCASSRNPAAWGRIEEHGPHVWCGCYDNAFEVMRAAYDELGRPSSHRFATLEQAFQPQDGGAVMDRVGGSWRSWPLKGPPNGGVPGQGGLAVPLLDLVRQLLDTALDALRVPGGGPSPDGRPAPVNTPPGVAGLLAAVQGGLAAMAGHGWQRISRGLRLLPLPSPVGRVLDRLDRARQGLAEALDQREDLPPEVRRGFVAADGALCIARGLVADGLIGGDLGTLDALDDEEWTGWLRRHGATESTLASGIVNEVYDLCFSFKAGQRDRADFAAGAALRTILRVLFTYKGAVLYTMRAGMGEAAIVPLYEVLARRGVRFQFFHHVDGLELTPDRRSVGKVRMRVQATVRGEYQPLQDWGGVACWPHEPLWDQLVEGERLAHSGVDLESPRSPWPTIAQRTLERGRDFDRVVLAIALGALPSITGPLQQASEQWRAMLTRVPTVATQVAFLWLRPDLAGLGWQGGNAFIGTFAPPFPNWGDWSHLLAEEGWSGPDAPRHLAYLCGPLPEPVAGPDTRAAQHEHVRRNLVAWLEQHARGIWPRTEGPDGGFDWNLLHDPLGRSGRHRTRAQMVRANTEPSERFVLATAGTVGLRPTAGDTGFDNLVVAGDWVRNGLNAACVEATVMSGRQAARALGAPVGTLVGEGSCAP